MKENEPMTTAELLALLAAAEPVAEAGEILFRLPEAATETN